MADAGFGNYLVASSCTYGFGYRLFHSFSFLVSFAAVLTLCNVQACALAACTVSVISTNDVAYLLGLHAARPSAFGEGAGFEPAMFKGTLAITIHIIKHRACLRPLGQPSKYIVFYVSSFCKPANLTAGWE